MTDTVSSIRRLPRPEPSGLQEWIGRTVLLCLLAIAAGLLLSQSRFNPAVIQFLESTVPAAPVSKEAGLPLIPLPENLAVLSPAERFDRETLSDKINGKAELYLSAGFVLLESQRFKRTDRADQWIEVYVFDMGSGQNAFAVFSSQRRPGVEPLDIVEFAYRADNAVFFASGRFYVEIIGSEKEETLGESTLALAHGFLRSRPAEASALGEKELFPKTGLTADGIRLVAADAFGLVGLDRVYTATYRLGGTELTAFLSARASPQEAAEWVRTYTDFLVNYGGSVTVLDAPVKGMSWIAILDFHEVVFSQGDFLAGVHEAPDKELALALADQLSQHLKEAGRAP